jgi:hypothetical protein
MSANLQVIPGGLANGGGSGSGGGGTGSGGSGRRKKRKHWLVDALWHAVVTKPRPKSADEIHHRVCRFMRQPLYAIPIGRIWSAICAVRESPEFYQWTLCHVAKGSDDTNRRYFPVLTDYDNPSPDGEPYTVWDDDDYPYGKYGAVSSARTVATMLKHETTALDALIPMAPADERRRLRRLQATLSAAQEVAEQATQRAARMAG